MSYEDNLKRRSKDLLIVAVVILLLFGSGWFLQGC